MVNHLENGRRKIFAGEFVVLCRQMDRKPEDIFKRGLNWCAVDVYTRQESNLRALGSRPNGDTGNPRLVCWIRRQESNLRGLRSERSWDASNPHLNKLAGRLGLEPSKVGFGDQPPRLRSTHNGGERTTRKPCPFGHPAVSSRVRRPGRFTLHIGGRRRNRNASPSGLHLFSRQRPTLLASPSKGGGCRTDSNLIASRLPAGFKAAASPARFSIQKWRRAVILPHKPVRVRCV